MYLSYYKETDIWYNNLLNVEYSSLITYYIFKIMIKMKMIRKMKMRYEKENNMK